MSTTSTSVSLFVNMQESSLLYAGVFESGAQIDFVAGEKARRRLAILEGRNKPKGNVRRRRELEATFRFEFTGYCRKAFACFVRSEGTHARRLQNGIEAYRRAWADAKGLIDRHGDMGQREAILQARDPRGSDGSVGHWRRVASIIAWRTGQHSIVSAQR